MSPKDQIHCPIPEMGYCIYDRCPYWDTAGQVCDADCLKAEDAAGAGTSEGPCTIHWTEDCD